MKLIKFIRIIYLEWTHQISMSEGRNQVKKLDEGNSKNSPMRKFKTQVILREALRERK